MMDGGDWLVGAKRRWLGGCLISEAPYQINPGISVW